MVLGIDTSGENLGLAICQDGDIMFSSLSRPGLRHGEIIQKVTKDFLLKNRISFNDLSGVSVTIGPGSFTGLRIGLSAAKGYSYSLGIPLAGVSTQNHQPTTNRPIASAFCLSASSLAGWQPSQQRQSIIQTSHQLIENRQLQKNLLPRFSPRD